MGTTGRKLCTGALIDLPPGTTGDCCKRTAGRKLCCGTVMANEDGARNTVLPAMVMAGRLETMPADGMLLLQAGAVAEDDGCCVTIERAAGEDPDCEMEGDDDCGGRNCCDAGSERGATLCWAGDENSVRVADPIAPEESLDVPGDESPPRVPDCVHAVSAAIPHRSTMHANTA